jgi:hypothetical protein
MALFASDKSALTVFRRLAGGFAVKLGPDSGAGGCAGI